MKPLSRSLPVLFGTVLGLLLCAGFVLGSTVGKDSVYRFLNVFAEVYALVRGSYVDPVEESRLLDGAYRGMAGGLDPFSGYLDRAQFAAFQRDPVGGSAATGLELLRVPGGAVVVAVRADSPAEKSGLRAGDQVWAIDGAPTRLMSLWEVRRAQRGEAGSTARLLVYHPKSQKREDLHLARAPIAGPSYQSRLIAPSIAYLRVLTLERAEREALAAALDRLREAGAARLLVDLRDCVGGSVDEAVALAGLFLPPGPVVQVEDRAGSRLSKASLAEAAWSLPVDVLVNGGTAGAAETVAAALRDRRGAKLIGETSYGLSVTQELVSLPSGDGLILSSSRLVAPSGENWIKGLKPDREIGATFEERAGLEPDRQLDRAVESVTAPAAVAPAA